MKNLNTGRAIEALKAAAVAALLLAGLAGSVHAAGPRFRVSIAEPLDGEWIYGKTKILAQVKSSSPVKGLRVEFSVAGKLIFIDREPPFECYHEFSGDAKSWVIEATAVAPDGTSASSTVVTRPLRVDYTEKIDRVLVAVSVTDKENTFIEGLTREDFLIKEDGVPQTIMEFSVERRPITLGVLIDTSGSMKEEIGEVQAAAKSFVSTLRPEDQAFIVDFDENVFLLQDFSSDHAELQKAIEGTDAEGGTAFYDALYVSYWKMRPLEGRKAIVALTDGEDTNSSFSYKRVLELTRTHDVIVYTIGLGSSVMDLAMRSNFRQIADDSGGRAFFPRTAADLAEVYQQIAADLRSQYSLAYKSTNRTFDGSWRKIEVDCRNDDARLKTRRGYYGVQQ